MWIELWTSLSFRRRWWRQRRGGDSESNGVEARENLKKRVVIQEVEQVERVKMYVRGFFEKWVSLLCGFEENEWMARNPKNMYIYITAVRSNSIPEIDPTRTIRFGLAVQVDFFLGTFEFLFWIINLFNFWSYMFVTSNVKLMLELARLWTIF